MKGFVEAVAEHEVRGWAYDETAPDQHLTVSAWLDGHQVGQSVAATGRADLRAAAIGDGDHGFRIRFERLLAPTSIGRLEVRAGEPGPVPFVLRVLPGSNHSRADQASDASIPVSDATQFPLFILGPARSGTSALALALLKSGGYQGHGEGHLFPLAQQLVSVVERYYAERDGVSGMDTTLRAVHSETFQRSLRRSFIQLTRAAFPTGRWLDKTPTAAMVRTAPLLLDLYPSARFIFMKRRVIENILSRRRKFPLDTLQNHYLDWVDVMSAWLAVRERIGSAALEIDQLDLARVSDRVAATISSFLTMPADKAERLRHALSIDHPEQTSEQVGLSASIETLGLDADDEQGLRRACDPVMRVFDYGYGVHYRASDEPQPTT